MNWPPAVSLSLTHTHTHTITMHARVSHTELTVLHARTLLLLQQHLLAALVMCETVCQSGPSHALANTVGLLAWHPSAALEEERPVCACLTLISAPCSASITVDLGYRVEPLPIDCVLIALKG